MLDIPNYKLKDDEEYRICKLEEKLTSDFLSPHQHHYFEIIFFTESLKNVYEHSIDFKNYPIVKNRLFFITSRQIHQWLIEKYSGEFKGYFIVFNESFVKADKALLELFDFLNDAPFLDLDDKEVKIAIKLIELIVEDTDSKNKAYQQSLIEALLHFFVDKNQKPFLDMSVNQKRFIELRRLIEEHYKEEKQAYFYAHRMNVSVKRLNEVLKSISSLSITDIIHQRVLLQAKRELSLGSKDIHEVAYMLGYDDPSYFSKFFKKHEGISPSKFMGR